MSEKFDGIQGVWTGIRLTTRNGHKLTPPEWWLKGMPRTPRIGELWMGYGTNSAEATTLMTAKPEDQAWRFTKFMSFDDRLDFTPNTLSYCEPSRVAVRGSMHILGYYAQVIDRGGEGIVIVSGDGITKLKPMQDAEALVIGWEPGKYPGTIASLKCRAINGPLEGIEFKLGSGLNAEDRQLASMPTGIVRFTWSDETHSGQPRSCVYLGRRDAATMDAVEGYTRIAKAFPPEVRDAAIPYETYVRASR